MRRSRLGTSTKQGLIKMTDEQAKALGRRALKLGMPWTEGVMDGHARWRLVSVEDAGLLYSLHSWPDFRDPITEAWLVAWASDFFARRGWGADEEPGRESLEAGRARPWLLYLSHNEMFIDVSGKSRAEAWIMALEKLKGEG